MNKAAVIIAAFVFGQTSHALAQTLFYDQDRVVSHKTTRSEHTFRVQQKYTLPTKTIFENLKPAVSVPAIVYSGDFPGEAGTSDGLPNCAADNIRQLPRSENEEMFLSLDVIVYDFEKSDQKEFAKQSAVPSIPYIEGALSNPYRPVGDKSQTIIRVLGISCLPTRVRSVTIDGAKAFEFREGKLAWQNDKSATK